MTSYDEQRTPEEIAAGLDVLRELDALDVMELDTAGDPAAPQRSLPDLQRSIWLTIRLAVLIMAGVVLVVAAIFRYKSPEPLEPDPMATWPLQNQAQTTSPVPQASAPQQVIHYFPEPDPSTPPVDARAIQQQIDQIYKWRLNLGEGIGSTLVMADESSLYVTYNPEHESGVLLKLDLDGNEQWRYEPGFLCRIKPIIGTDGHVYVRSSDNPQAKTSEMIALDDHGRERWRVSFDGVLTDAAFAPAGETMYLATNPSGSSNQGRNRRLLAVDQRGQVVWNHDYELGPSYSGHKRNLCVGPDGTVYFASSTGFNRDSIHRLEALTPAGAAQWSFDSPEQYIGEVLPLADGRLLIAMVGSDRCTGSVGLLSRQGKLVWQEHNGASNAVDMFALNGAKVQVITDELDKHFDHVYQLVALRIADGSEVWRLPADQHSQYTVAPDGVLYAWIAGDLVKIRQDGMVMWRNPGNTTRTRPQVGSGGVIYSLGRGIKATAPDGKELYTLYPESGICGRIWLGADDTLYFSTADGMVNAVAN